jgi:hypothetical protein
MITSADIRRHDHKLYGQIFRHHGGRTQTIKIDDSN